MKDSNIYLKNILDKAREAIFYCDKMSEKDFLDDSKTQSAVIMKLIVIGEESKKLPEEIKSKIDLPWKMIIGFRNMAVHEYFDIDLVQIWNTIQTDIPDLIDKIENYLK
ncbi:MAG: HepT-like ribonuclease domain-containing protein [Patescibacteria group bacterium]